MKNVATLVNKSIDNVKAKETYKTADTVNHEGLPAWKPSDSTRLEQMMMTGTLQNSFYVDQKDIVEDAIKFVREMAQRNSEELSRTAIKGRNEGFIRTMPMVGLVALSETNPPLFKETFNSIVKTGNDMEDFISMMRSFNRGFGRAIKKAMINWLENNLTEFYAMKYTKQCGYAMRIARPKSDNLLYDYIMHYAKDGKKMPNLDSLPQLKAYEECKIALSEKNFKKACDLIVEHRLDPSALIGVVNPDKATWKALSSQMGVMMLIKYLNKILREDAIDMAEIKRKITVENLKKAKVFPFRLYIAYDALRKEGFANQQLANYLADVLNDYIVQFDWEKWNKKIFIAPDISGSMRDTVRSGSKLTPNVIAGMLSGILYKGIKDSILVPWSDEIHTDVVRPRSDSVFTHMERIVKASGGGTHMYLPIKYMIDNKVDCDIFIGITDSEEWSKERKDYRTGELFGWLHWWKKYHANHPKSKAVLIRVDSYNSQPFSEEDAEKYNIHQVFGWNDNVLKYIEAVAL